MALTVGVIGGGQLARMMIPAAVNLGIQLRVLAENAGESADLATTMLGSHLNADDVLRFSEGVDVVTFDHEHVPQEILRTLVERGVAVRPGPDALLYAQDKLLMRERLAGIGLPVPNWARVSGDGGAAGLHRRQRRPGRGEDGSRRLRRPRSARGVERGSGRRMVQR